ncbi:MAG: glycosyltransferase family 4 protein [Chloroflexaceae bacterium]|nr:glycosyltransferase family 4 protein [Chloroflexaceae bacterium]
MQRSLTFQPMWRHPQGFQEQLFIHLPYDTLPALARYQPDVIISGELGPRTLQAVLYRRLRPHTRIIAWVTLSEHTEQGRGRARSILRRVLLRQVDAVIVNGSSGVRYIARYGVPAERIFCVPNPVDVSPWLALPLERTAEQAHRLLYVGRLVQLKGLTTFLDRLNAWARLHPDRTVQCWLAGDGPLRADLERLPLAPNVQIRFLGNVPYTLLPQVYGQAGILAFPTLSDTWGLVVNEALAAGLPVLGSRYSQAVEELISAGETGWTFRTDHAGELDAALHTALTTTPAELDRMRAAARAYIRSVTPEAVAAGMMEAVRYVT